VPCWRRPISTSATATIASPATNASKVTRRRERRITVV
jgi:hypothetical protein